MISAKEAKLQTDALVGSEIDQIVNAIDRDIIAAVDDGKYRVAYYNASNRKYALAKDMLMSLGYQVRINDTQMSGWSMEIMWGD